MFLCNFIVGFQLWETVEMVKYKFFHMMNDQFQHFLKYINQKHNINRLFSQRKYHAKNEMFVSLFIYKSSPHADFFQTNKEIFFR